ncbi:Holliday junction resolvase RecU [bacterium]|nr:Holliday junction resolvase RecU [bacterium]
MLYSNNIKIKSNKRISYDNRGMDLEYLINKACNYYIDKDIAYIYKKPTPIRVVRTSYSNAGIRITDAFFELPSTLDFNGLYKGHYIEFDAKKTKSKTSFPLKNISKHQIEHIKNIDNHGGIVFLIIEINQEYYCLEGYILLDFIKNEKRQSIPYNYIKDKGYKINMTINGLDYIKIVDEIIRRMK